MGTPWRLSFTIILAIVVFGVFWNERTIVQAETNESPLLILDDTTTKVDLYEHFLMLPDYDVALSIDDIVSGKYDNAFGMRDEFEAKSGFFHVARWHKLEVENKSAEKDWLIEFAFPLIYQIHIYAADEAGLHKVTTAGADFPFGEREIAYRHFIFNLDLATDERKTYYIQLVGGGDLHPPMHVWNKNTFFEWTQKELVLLGLFYGMIAIMILYNLFLYFSLRIRAYLYYVLAISSTLIGYMALNGDGYKYFWPDYPSWNLIAVAVFVSIASVFIIFFTKEFLDTDYHIPTFKYVAIGLIALNGFTILFLYINHFTALYLMVFSTFSTFSSVIIIGFISLFRGVRAARFFVLGWLVFLGGTFITILERSGVIAYSIFTEYAGQGALSIEVVLLSLALADKINIIRMEKEKAEEAARISQELSLESLRRNDKLKDEFLAITSHELRTPLYGMIGIAESLRDGIAGEISMKMKDQLEMIIISGQRLSHLVNDILDFSKLKHDTMTVHVKPVQISDLVKVVFTICQPLLKEKQVKLVSRIPDDLPAVLADADRLQQILYNLIGNAIKYTTVGEVVVTVKLLGEDQVVVTVSDTGKGIAPEYQKVIFEPFQQATNAKRVEGAGIGLSVTKQLVDLHGGDLTVRSEVGKGAEFRFTLAVATGGKRAVEEVSILPKMFNKKRIVLSEPNVSPKKDAIKVLVADDELINLQVLMNQLLLEGMEVVKTTSGKEVLKLVEKHDFDLIILDIMMPNMSGYEVCEQLRETYSMLELPVLMLTAKNQVQDKIMAFAVGANDYVTTPCDKEELLSRVKTLARLKSMNDELTILNMQLEKKVTERTMALEQANKDLQETNESLIKMAESRRNLMANIAHELGTPVMLLHSYVQALQTGLITGDDEQYRESANHHIRVLNRLIDDLADLSHLEAGRTSLELRTVDLYIWLEKMYQKFSLDVQTFGRAAEQDHPVFTKGMYECTVDMERMNQVFTNILSNAVKNTDETDGIITLNASINDTNDEIIIMITDNGVGMEQKMLPHIFDRFYKQMSDKEKTMGSGLGLTIVKEIIQGHRGRVWATSEQGSGSTFYISLPIARMKKIANIGAVM